MASLVEETVKQRYEDFVAQGLALNMKRGQPSDMDFDLSNDMLQTVGTADLVTPSGFDIRNYPGGVHGLPEARALFADVLGVRPEQVMVYNNASLMLQSHVLMWGLLQGMKDSPAPWAGTNPKMIVTVPGYDRHFKLLETLGYELVTVPMTPDGPDVEKVAELAAADPSIKGIHFVPTYSNPTGESISDDNVRKLISMETAAPDFTILADDAYIIHHLTDDPDEPLSLLVAAEEAGNPDRVYIFSSTSKVTFAGGGLGYMATSEANVAYFANLLGKQMIGPNKVEQYRHVKFLENYPDGITGLMARHAEIIAPKFEAVQRVLEAELGGTGLASWTNPKGGYFVSLDTAKPIADRVVELAAKAGVALTPAGATYPGGHDPNNSNIRLAPTRPPLAEVEKAMEVVAVCVMLASLETD